MCIAPIIIDDKIQKLEEKLENVIIENNINEYVDNYTAGGLYLNGEHQINNSIISI